MTSLNIIDEINLTSKKLESLISSYQEYVIFFQKKWTAKEVKKTKIQISDLKKSLYVIQKIIDESDENSVLFDYHRHYLEAFGEVSYEENIVNPPLSKEQFMIIMKTLQGLVDNLEPTIKARLLDF